MTAPEMWPKPGEHLLRYVGDRFRIKLSRVPELGSDITAFLRTNLTRAALARAEIIAHAGLASEHTFAFAGASWRDIPLYPVGDGFELDLPLLEVGHFRAKAYCVDARGHQYWPEGSDIGISVHPDRLRTANIIYCAFPRALGRAERHQVPDDLAAGVQKLDELGYAVIPPSGTLRNLSRALPHIFDVLGCRILHLLPIGPVPTTFARMGRYGSPYAQLDLTGIDPALVEFDQRTTAVDQFRELADGVHLRDGLVILDVVLNHTGWGSRLMESHPQWFVREADGRFHSPGAWGVVWADLVELNQERHALWQVLAESLITWCRRGVDGFRCDAGYMIPLSAWQYIIARVRDQYPNCVFLLEGLGGAFQATEDLLTLGGMQWAYSELFQCYEPQSVAEYLDHANDKSRRIGVLTHFSETHDNDRLAKRGAVWSNMRNHLCALSSHAGSFAFTSGVEWLCTQKLDVHEAHPLGWGQVPNLISELSHLNRLLGEHPCFFDGAKVERISAVDSQVLVLRRTSADGQNECLVVVNLDASAPHDVTFSPGEWDRGGEKRVDLLGQQVPAIEWTERGELRLSLTPGASYCLAHTETIAGLSGTRYRERRAQAAWAYEQLALMLPHEAIGDGDFEAFAAFVARDPESFLASIRHIDVETLRRGTLGAAEAALSKLGYRNVVRFRAEDAQRVVLLPPEHFLLIEDSHPFEAHVAIFGRELHLRSTKMDALHVVALPPDAQESEVELRLTLMRFGSPGSRIFATVRRLTDRPRIREGGPSDLVLLTNGRGGMARIYADLGRIRSKYDCLLAANLHPEVPEDRHILVKRLRAWVNADGFITALDGSNLSRVDPGPPAAFTFQANAGDGRRVGVRLEVGFVQGHNSLVLQLSRCAAEGDELPTGRRVSVTLRLDLEDRNFHHETHRTAELERHFEQHLSAQADGGGFVFAPDAHRTLSVSVEGGQYHPAGEWCERIRHDIDAERGFNGEGDAYSPGWFELPLRGDTPVRLVLCVGQRPSSEALASALAAPSSTDSDRIALALRRAAKQFIAARGEGTTVIAGYPWFLDWGRDTFIAARGLIAAGYHTEVRSMLLTYAAFEFAGTLPNHLAGVNEGSRETSDAPLWFALACEELALQLGDDLYAARAADGRSLREVLSSMAASLLVGAANGVRIDADSGLVYSPPHYTWMDTNYPAGTPREGYPIELSALWFRLLRQLQRLGVPDLMGVGIDTWLARVEQSFDLFWREDLGFFADTLHGTRDTKAKEARPDDHLRPNQLLAVSLGIVKGARARSVVQAATRYLLVPGALRTLAPLPVHLALPIRGTGGALLNDPSAPYWGHYRGDEDTQRKPAYHNGTAWPWWLATYCEALLLAHDGEAAARRAARAILGSTVKLLSDGCLGQIPEILDGDAPHQERGCDAQAWSVTETLRAWLLL